jgi:hypothetical protein
MCGGGGGGSVEQPKYVSTTTGRVFDDPNKAAEQDRRVQLASTYGYDPKANMENGVVPQGKGVNAWLATQAPEIVASYNNYDNQGLTAADKRSEDRLNTQEQQAKQAEEQRKSSIAAMRSSVDSAFGSFDDKYYSGISDSVLNYYLPQLDEQFGDAGNQLKFKLARQGLMKSTTAGNENAKLKSKYDIERSGVTNKAADAASQARENVSAAKASLYGLAESASDPAQVNTQLSQETARLRAYAPELTPMAKVFTDYLSPVISTVGTGLAAEAQGYPGFNTGIFNNGTSAREKVGGR